MEQPSLQVVGREFVRQYYTLLNRTPEFLYRLYGRNSSYAHGGQEPNGGRSEAVYGRAKIQEKIRSLEFRDTCSQIRLVDAHATINNGVLVHVIGELSNDGGPMRRFTQTFVLAAEGSAPNRFYVQNDWFLYYDDIFEDCEPEDESEDEVELEAEEEMSPEPFPERSSDTAGEPPHGMNGVEEPMAEEVVQPVEEEDVEEEDVEEAMEEEEAVEELVEEEAGEEPEEEAEEEAVEEEPEEAVEELEEEEAVKEPVEEPVKEAAEGPVKVPPPNVPEPPKTFQWSTVVKRNLPPPGATFPWLRPRPAEAASSQTGASAKRPNAPAQVTHAAKSRSDGVDRRGREDAKVEQRRHPESHQIFVGFIPHDVTEEELRLFFSTYGRVVDLQIKTKADVKVPNFGFVTFEGPEVVQTVLTSKPILLRNKIRLNVEKVKRRVAPQQGSHGKDERRDVKRDDKSADNRAMPKGKRHDQDGRRRHY